MENKMTETGKMTEGLFRFIDNSPTAFHAVSNAAEKLEKAGYARITGETRRKILYGKKWLGIDRLPDSGRGDKGDTHRGIPQRFPLL